MGLVIVILFLVCFVLNGLHIALIVGQNDFEIVNRLEPFGIPFNRNKAVIID